jgi:hypothetical protein
MTTDATEITVTRQRTMSSGRKFVYWHYYATGPDTITMPDGRVLPQRFDNRSMGDLRRVLRKHYGRDVRVILDWNVN